MKVKELIRTLMAMDQDAEVCVECNSDPVAKVVKQYHTKRGETVYIADDTSYIDENIVLSRGRRKKKENSKFVVEVCDLDNFIELSSGVKYAVYLEKQHDFDLQDIEDAFDCYDGDEECVEDHGITLKEAKPLFDKMATLKRRYIDKYDMSWQAARDEAISDVIEAHKKYLGFGDD